MKRTMSFRPQAGPGADWLAVLVAIGMALGTAVPATAQQAGTRDLSVVEPWLRFTVPGRPAGGYFALRNDGDRARALTGASSSACGSLMMHESANENGVARMRAVERVAVPAHGVTAFAPGGHHLMCMAPTEQVKPGGVIPVVLTFADGTHLRADFPVKSITGE